MSACLSVPRENEEAMALDLGLMVAMMSGGCYKILSTFLFMNYALYATCVIFVCYKNYQLCDIC
jgi:hypothetical protein